MTYPDLKYEVYSDLWRFNIPSTKRYTSSWIHTPANISEDRRMFAAINGSQGAGGLYVGNGVDARSGMQIQKLTVQVC